MPTLTGEDLEQVIRIAREIARQEVDARIPIHREILDLKSVVKDLVETHKRAEERLERLEKVVEELAEAQRRAEERLEGVEERLRRAEERLERLEKVVEELAEAQRRTEESIRELTKVYYSYDFEPTY